MLPGPYVRVAADLYPPPPDEIGFRRSAADDDRLEWKDGSIIRLGFPVKCLAKASRMGSQSHVKFHDE